jgi:hypothetical protein
MCTGKKISFISLFSFIAFLIVFLSFLQWLDLMVFIITREINMYNAIFRSLIITIITEGISGDTARGLLFLHYK